jgi:hypothetical protein
MRMPYYLGLEAEALYLAGRTREALETIEEAQAMGDRYEERNWCAERPSIASGRLQRNRPGSIESRVRRSSLRILREQERRDSEHDRNQRRVFHKHSEPD